MFIWNINIKQNTNLLLKLLFSLDIFAIRLWGVDKFLQCSAVTGPLYTFVIAIEKAKFLFQATTSYWGNFKKKKIKILYLIKLFFNSSLDLYNK